MALSRNLRFHAAPAVMALWASSYASTYSIEVSPGSLAGSLKEVPQGVYGLVISGSADISDLIALREGAGDVVRLDLSGLSITGGRLHDTDWYGRTLFSADEFPDYIFSGSPYTDIALPASLKRVGEGSFAASALTSVAIPSGLTDLGDYAFHGAPLKEISAGGALASIGKGCFTNCTDLAKVDFSGTSLIRIPDRCFAGCNSLQTVMLPASAVSIGAEAFSGTALTRLDAGCVTTLESYSLSGMPSLQEASVSSSAMKAPGIFFADVSLTGVKELPEEIPAYCFGGCRSIDVAKAISGARTLGEGAFAGSRASVLELGRHIDEIHPLALADLEGLEEINAVALGGAVPKLHADGFKGIDLSLVRLVVKADNAGAWRADPEWSRFRIVPDTNVGSLPGASIDDIRFMLEGGILTVVAPEERVRNHT